MAGSSWPSLVAGAKAKASEVEAKFDWSEQDITPHNAGTKTDATYDLGTSSFRFRDIHFSRIIFGAAGSVGAPSYSFSADPNTGMLSSGADNILLVTGGVSAINITSGQRTQFAAGSEALPSISFFGDTDTGMFLIAAGRLGIGVGGVGMLELNASSSVIISNVVHRFANGSAAAPSITINSDPDIGMFRKAANSLGLATAGVEVWAADSAGIITQPLQSSFLAFNSVTDANALGAGVGTFITIEGDTEVYDQNADYDNATDTFTAPIAGKYLFTAVLEVTDLDASVHTLTNYIIRTSNRDFYYVTDENTTTEVSGHRTFTISVIADMAASDTAIHACLITGGSADVDVIGAASDAHTYFSGSLIN